MQDTLLMCSVDEKKKNVLISEVGIHNTDGLYQEGENSLWSEMSWKREVNLYQKAPFKQPECKQTHR